MIFRARGLIMFAGALADGRIDHEPTKLTAISATTLVGAPPPSTGRCSVWSMSVLLAALNDTPTLLVFSGAVVAAAFVGYGLHALLERDKRGPK